MWFKNLVVYRLPENWAMTAETLQEKLAQKPLQPCGGLDKQSRGWVSVRGDERLVLSLNNQWLVALGMEQRLLPSSVVNQIAKERALELEAQQGYKVGRKALKELRERVAEELLPQAFRVRSTVYAWIDPVQGWLVIDAAAAAKAEAVLEILNKSIDDFPVRALQTEISPVTAMTDWVSASEAPAGFTIDRELELRSTGEGKSSVRYANHALEGDEILAHIAKGKRATRLGLTWNDRISFVLNEQLQLKKLSFLDIVREEASSADNEAELFELEFVLMSGELAKLLADLQLGLGNMA